MTKFTVIPAGYRITVTTWENDGDNYRHETVEGIESKLDARFIVELAKLAGGNSNWSNIYDHALSRDDDFNKAVKDLYEKHKLYVTDRIHDMFKEYEVDELADEDEFPYAEAVSDLMWELGIESSEWTRVTQAVSVEYVPEEIKIQDVTDEFI